MKGFRLAALAAGAIVAAGAWPETVAHGQTRAGLVRAFDFARGSRIGVSVQDIEDADAKSTTQAKAGVVVETVEPGGPADKAGVKAGDAITEFDGERVRSVRQFSRLVQETPSGRSVSLALARAGQRVAVTVTPERSSSDELTMRMFDMPAPPTPPAPPAAPSPRALPVPAMPFEGFRYVSRGRLGVTLESLDDQLAAYFGVKEGVLVKSVTADSAAQKAGVKAGDVITSVNGRQVYETSDVNRALDRAEDSADFTLEIVRDRKPQTIKGKLETRTRGRSSMSF